MGTSRSGILALEDGSVFRGKAFGAAKTVVGEAVFNTSMTGYQEILTDPSYYAQIVTMTASQIGNYGINPEDEESDGPKVSGFVVRDLSPVSSNWRSTLSLPEYLEKNLIPGLSGVDTRAITKRLRVAGAMKACLSTEELSDEEAVRRAKEWPGLVGVDYVKEVTCKDPYDFDPDGSLSEPFKITGTTLNHFTRPEKTFKVAAFDFGAKHSIFKRLHNHGFDVYVVPATASPEQVRELAPDALFLSNGPGDPSAVTYAHQSISKLMQDYPTFGICLGHQIITHALGAKTFKLKFGHRGGNQPVKNIETGQVSITSQNHGFASTRAEIEKCGGVVTELNLNDDTVEGLRHKELPIFSVQYHPEAAPGPNDADPLFTQFYEMVAKVKA
ncbi:glutamine-hydrolyzing carbamoyl-phosphate synthase small subunit [Ruficoccus sp. ZRK36]|uniref:glutamine-hydrolyzing carbamoyl-phosphate synthase small subunit n=1 Tax=Ruficoccus sp. ZRK36 TaxID=2866311 RepID=UPI001C739BB1|nr:glutamine-hydrolyzing carbamoyl-phosphate synthase small subunit [Ruficoccus sp. ZRK36]QYY37166.1 glutamine-hydrolyzing carbamoyl-phosphate synthase small subunit [Ruficoccus sp. ZRK36]